MQWQDRGWRDQRILRLSIAGAATMFVSGLPYATADPQKAEAEICSLAKGLQGRIEAIVPDDPAAHGTVYIQRGGQTREARIGCLLRANDVVRPGAGTKVSVKLPDRQEKIVDFNHPLVIPQIRSPNYLDRIVALLRDFSGADGSSARDIAVGTIGTTRSDSSAITMPGMVGVGEQYLDGSQPLALRWDGGTSPFHVELMAAEPSAHSLNVRVAASDRLARVNLRRLSHGDYNLTIAGKDRVAFTLPLHLVGPSEVPPAPGIDSAAGKHAKELVNAVWLLTCGGPEWRLEAISRLEMLATSQDDIVAQIILDRTLQ